ncbi:hypothetical protein E2C01_078965 [Portunus trituberculatus]|uniref:Uncharacterized protein n=1 Tax=Portunus trituberculatus TaxID=210409 RepID=A0A5B7IRI9_PORTR|nr:hypothetical protein [Portunus trituberculatus]
MTRARLSATPPPRPPRLRCLVTLTFRRLNGSGVRPATRASFVAG